MKMFKGQEDLRVRRAHKLLKEYLAEQTEAKIHAFTSSTKNPAVPPAMYAQFFAGAVINTLAWRLEQGMPYAPQQMARYLLSCQEPAGVGWCLITGVGEERA